MLTQSPTIETTPKKKQVQPRHHASKGRLAVALRQKKIIKALAEGKTQAQAGIDSGLSPKTAAQQVNQILKNPTIENALITALEKHGVSDDCIAERLRVLLFGKKVISANVFAPGSSTDLADAGSMTKDFVEVDDNQAIAKGIELACKIKGQFAPDKHDVNIKRPINVIIRRFGTPPPGSDAGGQPG